jgi:hypothetical protein
MDPNQEWEICNIVDRKNSSRRSAVLGRVGDDVVRESELSGATELMNSF